MGSEQSKRPQQLATQREARTQLFREILKRKSLSCVFQPIISFYEQHILGFEALIRGPKDSIFHAPIELFSAAQDLDSLAELSGICVNTVLQQFAALRLPGKLFLNISPRVVGMPGFDPERAVRQLSKLKLKPEQIVIELTEQEPTLHFDEIRASLMIYRAMGFRVAIDDLGEGFSSLRLWSELKPEFVKADKHFVTGIADDPIKIQFLKAIQQIAESCGSRIIAEGIETESDFKMVQELGIACGQGFFIGHPLERPAVDILPAVRKALDDLKIPVMPTLKYRQAWLVTAAQFLRPVPAVSPSVTVRDVIALFASQPDRYACAVVDAGKPVGFIARRHVRAVKHMADTNAAEFSQPARSIMNVAPLLIDVNLSLAQIAVLLADATPQHLADGFILTKDGQYQGMGNANDVIRMLNDANLIAARYTSPLTLLPGPVPINQQIERLLAAGVPFVACMAEIDPMKGFNDAYGFQKGDELIRLGGDMLKTALNSQHDFVGHIYGNRFVLLLQNEHWQPQLTAMLKHFESRLTALLSADIVQRGNFLWQSRDSNRAAEVRPLPRLAIGAVEINADVYESRHDVMSAVRDAVNRAKAQRGSNIVLLDSAEVPAVAHSPTKIGLG